MCYWFFFFFSSRRRHTRFDCDWSSDVCSSDLVFRKHFYVPELCYGQQLRTTSNRQTSQYGDALPNILGYEDQVAPHDSAHLLDATIVSLPRYEVGHEDRHRQEPSKIEIRIWTDEY